MKKDTGAAGLAELLEQIERNTQRNHSKWEPTSRGLALEDLIDKVDHW